MQRQWERKISERSVIVFVRPGLVSPFQPAKGTNKDAYKESRGRHSQPNWEQNFTKIPSLN